MLPARKITTGKELFVPYKGKHDPEMPNAADASEPSCPGSFGSSWGRPSGEVLGEPTEQCVGSAAFP